MKKANALTAVLLVLPVVIAACQSRKAPLASPTAASPMGDGTSSASFATPSSSPIGPVPGPAPGPGPASTPIGPHPGGPTPTPTPTPEPTPSATPTPTATPIPCPPTLTITAADTPRFLAGAINNDALFPKLGDFESQCTVKEVKISMRLTTATGFGSTRPNLMVGVCGVGVGFSGCSASGTYGFLSNATGNAIGATCGDFVFDTAAATVFDAAMPPSPPYSGTYQWDPARDGVGELWRLNSLEYSFINTFNHPPDTVLECAQIVITTQLVPGPGR